MASILFDTQLFVTFLPKDRLQAIKKIEACIADIRPWCQFNNFVLNDSKTELIYCSSKFVESSWEPSIKIGDATILPSARARNLGVITDSTLSMGDHVNNVCKGALAGIRKIGQIRSYLTEDATVKLVHAFVTSRLDSCNSLLFGLPDHDIRKVQMDGTEYSGSSSTSCFTARAYYTFARKAPLAAYSTKSHI